jgi:hypothetical protein
MQRQNAIDAWIDLMGPFPAAHVPLEPKVEQIESREGIEHYHVSFAADQGDRITAICSFLRSFNPGIRLSFAFMVPLPVRENAARWA